MSIVAWLPNNMHYLTSESYWATGAKARFFASVIVSPSSSLRACETMTEAFFSSIVFNRMPLVITSLKYVLK